MFKPNNAKNILKIYICAFIVLLSIVAHPVHVKAQDASDNVVRLGAEFNLNTNFSYSVNAYCKSVGPDMQKKHGDCADTAYILTLPCSTRQASVKVQISGDAVICDDNNYIKDGQELVLSKDIYYLLKDNEKYIVQIIFTSDIPQLYIDTESGNMDYIHEDKNNRESSDITVVENGVVEYAGELEYIKGRGNTSWKKEQKPYSIKFAGKVSLFGMDASKKYNLVVPGEDSTFLKNKIILDLAEKAGIKFCAQTQFVDLYCNNEYMGLYLFTEKNEVESGRVNIFDIDAVNEQANPGVNLAECEKIKEQYETLSAVGEGGYRCYDIPNDIAKNIDGGYLLEFDFYQRYKYNLIDNGFITDYGQTFSVSNPQYISVSQMEYIRDYYQQFEDALLSADGYNSQGKYYAEYIDVESAAKMYVLHELVQETDVATSSCFIAKDINGKMVMCAPWDFDRSMGYGASEAYKDIWLGDRVIISDATVPGRAYPHTIFSQLWTHSDFRKEVVNQWENVFEPNMDWFAENNRNTIEEIYDSAVAEECRWHQQNYITLSDAKECYAAKTDKLNDFVEKRESFLENYFVSDANGVFYGNNSGYGVMVDALLYTYGSEAYVAENRYTRGETEFIGWNTQPDGSGKWYYPHDTIEMNGEDVFLFAQWYGVESEYIHHNPPKADENLFESIMEIIGKIINGLS